MPLSVLLSLSGLAKTHGVQIKASGAMLRLRLYQSLALLPPNSYEGSFHYINPHDYGAVGS